jgi:hypothetical protein
VIAMEIFIAILIFIAVVVVAALVFGGWLIIATVRLVGRALGSGGAQSYPGRRIPSLPHLARCEHAGCLAENPRSARFCRRCGRVLGVLRAAPARRVAIL